MTRLKCLGVTLLLLGSMLFASPVLANCVVNRASNPLLIPTAMGQDHQAQSGVRFETVQADIDIQRPSSLENNGVVQQYIELANNGYGIARVGVQYKEGIATRLFAYIVDVNNQVVLPTTHFSIGAGSTHALLKVKVFDNGPSWNVELWNGTTLLSRWYLDNSEIFFANHGRKVVTSNNDGNSFPGTTDNLAYFRNPTYITQYGGGTWAGTFVDTAVYGVVGSNSTGMWTRDRDC